MVVYLWNKANSRSRYTAISTASIRVQRLPIKISFHSNKNPGLSAPETGSSVSGSFGLRLLSIVVPSLSESLVFRIAIIAYFVSNPSGNSILNTKVQRRFSLKFYVFRFHRKCAQASFC